MHNTAVPVNSITIQQNTTLSSLIWYWHMHSMVEYQRRELSRIGKMCCNSALMNVMLRNMALPCIEPNITPIQCTIIFTRRVEHGTTTVNGTNVVQSAWWECAAMRVCACVVPHCILLRTRGKPASYPTTWSLSMASWSRLRCAVLLCTAGPDSPKHLEKPCSPIPDNLYL